MAQRGRPAKRKAQDRVVLQRLTLSHPSATWAALRDELHAHTGVWVHEQTLRTVLTDMGIERRRGAEDARVVARESDKRRYGYTAAHPRHTPEQTYPSCRTDVEWELVNDLFDNEGARGAPPRYARRLLSCP